MKTLQQHQATLQSAAQAPIKIECNTEAAVAGAACKLGNLSVLYYWVSKSRCCNPDVKSAHSHSTEGSLVTAMRCFSKHCEDRHMVHYMLLMHKNLHRLQQG